MQDTDFHVSVGDSVSFAKTISESDVYLFAGITGDLSDVHCNAQYMSSSAFGERIAHGVLTVGLMSTASTLMYGPHVAKYAGYTPVSQGYDKIRFMGPVFFGDTVTITYTVSELQGERQRALAEVTAANQRGHVVAKATHVMRWVTVAGEKQ
ncbi:MaoC family dehydratase [Pseudohoeflea coraliihabitans]|uniref:MaoC family dehydratase n=1 Tax=Pseudohoeflea coraliihabitans TaxID=2860393 RepID=A0ABS6WTP7_9HYPH|nr:MaoC family dehydratase [Pseudohoeflea sp. DP4N28-3]MBW3098444.1 MaoC family dehydratase [Pseudohoeflea sp. DP4N28-3]